MRRMVRANWLPASAAMLAGVGVGWCIPLEQAGPLLGGVGKRNTTSASSSKRAGASPVETAKVVHGVDSMSEASSAASPDQLESDFRRLWEASVRAEDKDIDREVQALMKLAVVDPYRAVSLAMKLEGSKRKDLLLRLLESMKTTSQHALRALLENPGWKSEWQVVNAIFENLAKVDPRLAWEEATRDGRTFADITVFSIASEWGVRAPGDAVAFAGSIADRELRKRFTDAVFGKWIATKTDDFIAWYRSLPDPTAWTEEVPWQSIRVKTKEQFLAVADVCPARLAHPQFDGQSAFDGVFKQPEHQEDYLAWVSSIPDEEKRTTALTSLAKAILNWNPEDALPLLASVKDENARTQITSAAAAWRAMTSPAEGVAFADALEGNARALALRSAIATWAESDPAGAAAYMVTRPQDFTFDGTRTDALRDQMDSVVGEWAKHDPLAAASFALAQKEADMAKGVEERANYGLRAAMNSWVSQDAYAASAWVTSMPAGRMRDMAAEALAGAAMNIEPIHALGWAMSIGDAEISAASIRECVTSWTWRDAQSAGEWVKTARIDEALRSELSAVVAKRTNSRGPTSSVSGMDKTVFY